MKFYILLSMSIIAAFFGCKKEVKLEKIYQEIAYIEIIKEDSSKQVFGQKVIESSEDIKKVLSFIKNETSPEFKCGYDFHIKCIKKNKEILLIDVNTNELCRNAVFVWNDEVHHRYISDEGVAYLQQVIEN